MNIPDSAEHSVGWTVVALHWAGHVLADRRVANMTVEQLADLSRVEDVEEMADDLALQLGVESDRHHYKYNDHDILEGLRETSEPDSPYR